jgi:uncharacterized membrane protein
MRFPMVMYNRPIATIGNWVLSVDWLIAVKVPLLQMAGLLVVFPGDMRYGLT